MKRTGQLVGSFEKHPRYQDPALWAWLEYFSPLRGTTAEYPDRYRKSSRCVPFKLNTLRGTKTAFLTPKRFDQHPCPFNIGVLPGGIHVSTSFIFLRSSILRFFLHSLVCSFFIRRFRI